MRSPPPRRAERHLRVVAAAWTAFGGLVLVAASRGLNAAPLLLPGIGLVVIAWLAVAWMSLASIGASVVRRALPARVIEGEPFPVTVEVNGRGIRFAEVSVSDPVAASRPLQFSVPHGCRGRLRRRRNRGPLTATATASAGRRGRQLLPLPHLVVADPLGLAQVTIAGGGARDELLVLPRIEPVRWPAGRRGRLGGDQGSSREPTGSGEVDGLREYRVGTPATRIHWPALARGAGLLERRLVAANAELPLVVLDARSDGGGEELERLDAAVRAAASIVRELAVMGGCQLLLPRTRLPLAVGQDLRAWPGIHSRLALIEPEPDPRRGPALRVDQLGGPLVYVAASRSLELPGLRRAAPRSLLLAPVGADDPPATPAFEVAGCAAHPLNLRTLRRAA